MEATDDQGRYSWVVEDEISSIVELWECGMLYFSGRVDLAHSICNSREFGKGRSTSPL